MTKLEKSRNSGSSFSQIKIFGRQRNDDAYTSAGFSHLVQANANDQFKITWYDGQVHINNTFIVKKYFSCSCLINPADCH